MDVVHDQLAAGRKLRILTVVDTYSRFCPILDPRFSYRGEDVVATLERNLPLDGLSEDDPGRSGNEICLSGSRPPGLPEGRHSLPAWQAGRQCVHRSVQRPIPDGMPQRTLVLGAGCCQGEIGALASRLQRGQTSRRDQQHPPIAVINRDPASSPPIAMKPGTLLCR